MPGSRSIQDLENQAHKAAAPRRARLMLIGINTYEHWPPLAYPVRDCLGFFRVLQQHYGFSKHDLVHTNWQPLFDEQATTDMIYDELYRLSDKDEWGNPHLGPNDNLIIYFAGHGHLDKTVDEGYWAPADAPLPKRPSDLKKLISVSEVVKILSAVQAHHIVLIVDACFPQTFARMAVDVPTGGTPNSPKEWPSRWVLTSGRLEPVVDKSPFAEALCHLLESNDKPCLSVLKLGADIMEKVRNSGLQNAWSGSLTENRYDGGEFFFYRQSPPPVAELTSRPDIDITALPQRMHYGSQQYLERLKTGRFKYLRIEKLLLTETNLPDFVDTQVKVQEEWTPLHKALAALWGQNQPHAVVLGEGGMGKTVSLLRLWEDWLQSSSTSLPIFVALNEYNVVPEPERTDFVMRSIARNCGLVESLTEDWKNALWDIIRQPRTDGAPAILLLLDGFNEVTAERTPLLIELNRIAQEAGGVQMVITSRYVEIRNFQWAQQSEILELQPLPADAIRAYMGEVGLLFPKDEVMSKLLGNPMMLTIYAGSNQIANRHKSDVRFRFLPSQSVGELLWNFSEAQLVKYYEDHAHDPDEQAWHRFLLRCLLPYIAYRMEEHGVFFLAYSRRSNPDFNFKLLLGEAFTALNHPELTEIFPEFEGKRSFLGLSEELELDAREQRARRVREYLVDKLNLLVFEKEELRFLHQNFRDFFAACYLLNMVDMNTPAPTWTMRTMPIYLRRMLGQIEGQHRYDPIKMLRGEPMPGFQPENRLVRLLDRYRGCFKDEAAQVAVMNVVRTLAEERKTLAGADLRRLDLQKVYFSNIPLSAQRHYHYLPAQLDGALLKSQLLFAQGHSNIVNSVCYSPDGKKILSGSGDGKVKEWLMESGECLFTFTGNSGGVNNVCYSPNGKKILAGFDDYTVKEWSVETGKCLQTFDKHTQAVTSVCYSPDGKKILSGSNDSTVKEWSVKTGKCMQTFKGHSQAVSSVCYSPDGKKILTGSNDNTVKEWSAETGKYMQTFKGHSRAVTSARYNLNGNKILTGSSDNTVKEWSVKTGECLHTFEGHSQGVSSVYYSPDGKRVLSGSVDYRLKEWLVESGECLQTFEGYSDSVNCVRYSPDGKKILLGSDDNALKEWLVETGECLQTFEGHEDRVLCVCYSHDGNKILSGSADNTLKEWSVETGECLHTFEGHSNPVKSVFYSADGKKILSASYDRILIEWSVDSGQCLQTFEDFKNGIPEGSYEESGQFLNTIEGYLCRVNGVCFSQDGEKICSKWWDYSLKEWSVQTGACLQTLYNEVGLIVQSCDFSRLHPDSVFTKEERARLCQYGAIFNEKDRQVWEATVAEARTALEKTL